MAPVNGSKTWIQLVQQVGFPIAAFFAMGWAAVNFWLKPQTDMMQALTETNRAQAKAYEGLHETVTDTNKIMRHASEMMNGMPDQREEQLRLMKEQSDLLQSVSDGIKDLKHGGG